MIIDSILIFAGCFLVLLKLLNLSLCVGYQKNPVTGGVQWTGQLLIDFDDGICHDGISFREMVPTS